MWFRVFLLEFFRSIGLLSSETVCIMEEISPENAFSSVRTCEIVRLYPELPWCDYDSFASYSSGNGEQFLASGLRRFLSGLDPLLSSALNDETVFVLLWFFDARSSRFPDAFWPLPCLPEPVGSCCFLLLLVLSRGIMNSALFRPSLEMAVACVWLSCEKCEPFLVDWLDCAVAGSGSRRDGLAFAVRR